MLQEAIECGINSGVSENTIPDIMKRVDEIEYIRAKLIASEKAVLLLKTATKSLQDLKIDYAPMGNYRLAPDAEEDLWRIYHWGFRKYGEAVADKYYSAFFDRFQQLAD